MVFTLSIKIFSNDFNHNFRAINSIITRNNGIIENWYRYNEIIIIYAEFNDVIDVSIAFNRLEENIRAIATIKLFDADILIQEYTNPNVQHHISSEHENDEKIDMEFGSNSFCIIS